MAAYNTSVVPFEQLTFDSPVSSSNEEFIDALDVSDAPASTSTAIESTESVKPRSGPTTPPSSSDTTYGSGDACEDALDVDAWAAGFDQRNPELTFEARTRVFRENNENLCHLRQTTATEAYPTTVFTAIVERFNHLDEWRTSLADQVEDLAHSYPEIPEFGMVQNVMEGLYYAIEDIWRQTNAYGETHNDAVRVINHAHEDLFGPSRYTLPPSYSPPSQTARSSRSFRSYPPSYHTADPSPASHPTPNSSSSSLEFFPSESQHT